MTLISFNRRNFWQTYSMKKSFGGFFYLMVTLIVFQSAHAQSFTFDQLLSHLKNPDGTYKQIDSLDQLLPQLPLAFRQNFTLIHTSGSIQKGSYEAPRVLMFGEDARLVVAFNSGESHFPGHSSLEVMHWVEQKSEFEFRQIHFAPQKPVHVSKANPPLCLNCHASSLQGVSPHPLWNDYNHWPSAYGGSDDYINPLGPEKKAFLTFKEEAKTHPRYKNLAWDENENEVFPYYSQLPHRQLRYMPNSRLNTLLMYSMGRRYFYAAQKSPLYQQVKSFMVYQRYFDKRFCNQNFLKQWQNSLAQILSPLQPNLGEEWNAEWILQTLSGFGGEIIFDGESRPEPNQVYPYRDGSIFLEDAHKVGINYVVGDFLPSHPQLQKIIRKYSVKQDYLNTLLFVGGDRFAEVLDQQTQAYQMSLKDLPFFCQYMENQF